MYLNEIRDRLFNFMLFNAAIENVPVDLGRYMKPLVPTGWTAIHVFGNEIRSDNLLIIIIDTCIILISR